MKATCNSDNSQSFVWTVPEKKALNGARLALEELAVRMRGTTVGDVAADQSMLLSGYVNAKHFTMLPPTPEVFAAAPPTPDVKERGER